MRTGSSTAAALGLSCALVVLAACTHVVEGTSGSGSPSPPGASGASTTGADGASAVYSPAELCRVFVDCAVPGVDYDVCVATLRVVRTSPLCAEQASSLTCSTVSEFRHACLPDCSPADPNRCEGDGTITLCGADSWRYRVSCEAYCEASAYTWTGECGRTNPADGTVEPTEICWCRN